MRAKYTFFQTKDWVNKLSASMLKWKPAQAMYHEEKTTIKHLQQKTINVVFLNFPITYWIFLMLADLVPCMCEKHQVKTEILGGTFLKSSMRVMYCLTRIFQYCLVCSAELKIWGKASRAIFCCNHLALSLIQSCSEDPGRAQSHCFLFSCTILKVIMRYSISKVIYSCSLQFFFQKKWTITALLHQSRA